MNRNIWTWIQLAASITNATFLVVSHVPTGSAAEIATMLVGQGGPAVLAKAAQGGSAFVGRHEARL
jgi:hypothetical protein